VLCVHFITRYIMDVYICMYICMYVYAGLNYPFA